APQPATGVSNPIFSPNQPSSAGAKDITDITISNPATIQADNITARIRVGTSIGGTLVRELSLGSLPSGQHAAVTWDGKDAGGVFVADGVYTARAFSPCTGE